jgi:hypothetical protein
MEVLAVRKFGLRHHERVKRMINYRYSESGSRVLHSLECSEVLTNMDTRTPLRLSYTASWWCLFISKIAGIW